MQFAKNITYVNKCLLVNELSIAFASSLSLSVELRLFTTVFFFPTLRQNPGNSTRKNITTCGIDYGEEKKD